MFVALDRSGRILKRASVYFCVFISMRRSWVWWQFDSYFFCFFEYLHPLFLAGLSKAVVVTAESLPWGWLASVDGVVSDWWVGVLAEFWKCWKFHLLDFSDCWLNHCVSAGAKFDVFLEGCFRFQIRLLLPRAFFEFLTGVSTSSMRWPLTWSWRDLSCRRRSEVCFLVQSVISPVRVWWVTGISFWIASAMC